MAVYPYNGEGLLWHSKGAAHPRHQVRGLGERKARMGLRRLRWKPGGQSQRKLH